VSEFHYQLDELLVFLEKGTRLIHIVQSFDDKIEHTPDNDPYYKNNGHIDDRIPGRILKKQELRVFNSQNVFHPNILLDEKSRSIKEFWKGGKPGY
jgi:hypothetical protein